MSMSPPIYAIGEKKPEKKNSGLPMCGFIVQLVEHHTSIRGGHGFESR